jgi:TonB family protein
MPRTPDLDSTLIRFSLPCGGWLALALLSVLLTLPVRAQITTVPGQKQSLGAIADFGGETPAPAAPGPSATPGVYVPAKVRTRAPVGYPTLASLNRIQGTVTIRFHIDESGHVIETTVASPNSNALLNQLNTERSLLQWTFVPATLNGQPVPSIHDQEFEFKLDPEEQKKLAIERLALSIGTPDPPYPPGAAASHLEGKATIGVFWTKQGLVDKIDLVKSSGAPLLDIAALRFAYEHWRLDPAAGSPDKPYVKTVTFTAPH